MKSQPVARRKDAETADPAEPAFSMRVGKDISGIQFLEISSGARRAIIEVTDLLLPPKELGGKLLVQGIPVASRTKLAEVQQAAERAVGAMDPSFTLVSRPGWIGNTAFAHGTTLVGTLPKGWLFRPEGMKLGDRPAKFGVRGTLRGWKRFARRIAKGQPLVTFLLCVAFVSMILRLVKIQPFVIMPHALSSVGKSYLAKFIGSVAGGDLDSPETGFGESFKATDVGTEKFFLAHKDLILLLNEYSRVQGSNDRKVDVLEAMVNDLCSGIPKTLGTDQKGGQRYSSCGIVTSNVSYGALLANAHRDPAEAMGPRLFDICANMGTGLGIFTTLPSGFGSSGDAVKAMRDAADKHYGWPARMFAERICERNVVDARVIPAFLEKWQRNFSKRIGANLTGVPGQIRDKLAAAGGAGTLAKKLGILPAELEITPAILWAWNAISKQAPTDRPDSVEAVAAYIKENKAKFRKTPLPRSLDEEELMKLPGLIHGEEYDREYLIPKRAFDRAFGPLGGSKIIMPHLVREGLAVAENVRARKFQIKRQVGPNLRVRVYAIKAEVLQRGREK